MTNYWAKRENINANNIKAYLFIILRNECYQNLNKNKIKTEQIEVIQEIQVYDSFDSDTTSYDELTRSLHRSLEGLPKRCREIFLMSRIHGVSNDIIASELKISKRTVENQLSKH